MKKILILLLLVGLSAEAKFISNRGKVPVLDTSIDVSYGNVSGTSSVNKFGRTTNADNGIRTDVWDRANAIDDQDIHVPPTQARIHNIVSSDVDDTSGGAGARTLKIFGLTSWDEKEVNEIISMSGTSTVTTSNSYVYIHRMLVMSSGGGTGANQGQIIAQAQTDLTISAQINPLEGQTQMALYAISSKESVCVTQYYSSFNKSGGATGSVDVGLCVNIEPNNQLSNFIIKNTQGLISSGTSQLIHSFNPCFKIDGPAIIKVDVTGSANDLDLSAGFDLVRKDN